MSVASAAIAPAAVDAGLVRAHSLAALATLLVSVLFGITVSLQFLYPDLTGGSLTLGWGRLRYAHTQGIMLGWLGNAFLAFLYHAIPVLTGRRVTNAALGWCLFGLWNFVAVVPGWILVLAGISQPLEWAEFPLVIDAFIMLALLLAAVQFLPGFFRSGLDSLYVSGWYILGGLVFTLLAYPMGNLVPELVSGATSAAFGGLWIHDAVGLFVTPLALAILYYVIPAASGRPIYSHFLSMLGFWGLFFFYPLNGTHHYVFSVIPMAAQVGAIAASVLLGVIVVVVVSNLLLSLRGTGFIARDPALRFVALAVVFYFIVSIQGASQAQMALNRFLHFSDWVIGHSHLAMLGFATFAAIGGLLHAWQRLPNARYNPRAIEWSFWLLTFGISVMVIDLTIAGLVQGGLWQQAVPWLESVKASRPYWIVRSLSAIPITAGFVLLGVGLLSGKVGAGMAAVQEARTTASSAQDAVDATAAPGVPDQAGSTSHQRGLTMAYVVTCVAGIGFFALSMLLLGLWPGQEIDAQIAATSPPNVLRLSDAEQRGRQIYAREGCAYCHTQQVRFLEADISRYGAPTLAWETQFDSPHLWGTRRIGPDLARSSGTHSLDWHCAHLFAPRSVVAGSIMPSYAGLFDGSPLQPTQEARDLVAYLETLGRARALAWPEGEAVLPAADMGEHMDHLAQATAELNAHPAATRTEGDIPDFTGITASSKGPQLWLENCASCHGIAGRGDGAAADWLTPRPANLAQHRYAPRYLQTVLWNGVPGSSMPAWRDLNAADLLALAAVVASFATSDDAALDAATLQTGAVIYARHCVQCHGVDGRGDGFAASYFGVPAVDFTQQQASLQQALSALENGVPGTPMAPWTDRLDADERRAVANYVRAFFVEDTAASEATNAD
jgi:cytochrome c oxidase cbb3-type subunit I/II